VIASWLTVRGNNSVEDIQRSYLSGNAANERRREHQFLTPIFRLKVSLAFRACAFSFSNARAR
jgi:hypothetical protein